MLCREKVIIPVILLLGVALLIACQPKTVSSEEPPLNVVAQPEPTPKKNEPIKIAAVGDVMLGSPFPNDTRMPPNDGADLLK